MKKTNIKINFDPSCHLCQKGLQKFSKLQKRNEDVYGNRNLKTGKRIGGLMIIPDYNAYGIMTHWHIK